MSGATEYQGGRIVPRTLALLFSVAAHITVVMLLVGLPQSALSTRSGKMQAASTDGDTGATRIVHLYLPPRRATARKATVGVKSAGPRESDHGVADLNLTGIRLSIQDDPDFQLLPVLRRYKGYFGLARADQNDVITRLYRANDFKQASVNVPRPREDYFAVKIVEPSAWPLGTELAEAVRADEMLVFALFPRSFVNRLDRAIRQSAGATDTTEFKITKAVICFSATEPDGFRIEHVVVIPSPAQEKPPHHPDARSQEDRHEATR